MTEMDRPHYPLELGSGMTSMDAIFWYAEQATPELRPLVAALLMLDRRPSRERLHACVGKLDFHYVEDTDFSRGEVERTNHGGGKLNASRVRWIASGVPQSLQLTPSTRSTTRCSGMQLSSWFEKFQGTRVE